jgi:hypothetical protein
LTYHTPDDVDSDRCERDDSAEIEVTPEMIEAGAIAVAHEVGGADLGGWFSADALAVSVFSAMAAAGGLRLHLLREHNPPNK